MKHRNVRIMNNTPPMRLALSLLVTSAASLTSPTVYAQQRKSGPSAQPAKRSESVPNAGISQRFEQGKPRFVHTNKAILRSGPGDQFYPTSQLATDSRVDVYLETTDGWSGIRPPDGSHNWIPASAGYLLPGGKTAEIVTEDTPAWIGSQLAVPSKMQWHTGLQKSQIVQILGEETQESEEMGKSLWYRIAPPQGEFRWVKTSSLSDSPSGNGASTVQLASHRSAPSTNASPNNQSRVVKAGAESVAEGEVVWSDESEVLAGVDREIRAEQARISADIPQGANVHDHADSDFSEAYSEAAPVETAMSPAELARAKRHKNAQHQVDSLRHWDALQATDPNLRVKPLSSVLGLIGFGVIEADRKPVNDRIAEDRNRFIDGEQRYANNLDRIGPAGSNRLDHLPRPGRSPRISSPTAGQMEGLYSQPGLYDAVSTRTDGLPLDPNRPVLSRLWASNQPLFGTEGAGGSAIPSDPAMREWIARDPRFSQPNLAGVPWLNGPSSGNYTAGNDAWHGMNTPSAMLTSQAMLDAHDDSGLEANFESPEIQQAMFELNKIVASPTENWHLADLRSRCHQWIELGGTSLVRGEARLLMERIDRFDALRTRTLGSQMDSSRMAMTPGGMPGTIPPSLAMAAQPGGVTNATSLPPSSVNPSGTMGSSVQPASAQSSTVPSGADTSVGDATGWLVQVHGTVPGQPEYALTDDQGKVITYVQSTAALNLRRYLQQPVIVYGQRGYIPSLAARQINVERVSRLR